MGMISQETLELAYNYFNSVKTMLEVCVEPKEDATLKETAMAAGKLLKKGFELQPWWTLRVIDNAHKAYIYRHSGGFVDKFVAKHLQLSMEVINKMEDEVEEYYACVRGILNRRAACTHNC